MKTRTTIKLAALACALAFAPASQATLILAWYDFPAAVIPSVPIPANVAIGGVSGSLSVPVHADVGGSDDGFFGNSGYAVPSGGAGGDGFGISGTSIATLTITNTTGSPLPLAYLYFDFLGSTAVTVRYDGTIIGVTAVASPVLGEPYQDFDDYGFVIDEVLADGASVDITFTGLGGSTAYALDNIALVPEPGSVLALGGVLGAGLFIRRRNRR